MSAVFRQLDTGCYYCCIEESCIGEQMPKGKSKSEVYDHCCCGVLRLRRVRVKVVGGRKRWGNGQSPKQV